MGMFDYVTVPPEAQVCPACGAKVDEFQSKDGDCWLATIDWRACNRFYTSCDKCEAWIEYRRTPRPPPTSLAEFQCSVTTKAQIDAENAEFRKAMDEAAAAMCRPRTREEVDALAKTAHTLKPMEWPLSAPMPRPVADESASNIITSERHDKTTAPAAFADALEGMRNMKDTPGDFWSIPTFDPDKHGRDDSPPASGKE